MSIRENQWSDSSKKKKNQKQKQLEIIAFDQFTVLLDESTNDRGFIHAVFDMVISTLRTIIWVCSNLILSKVKTTSNNNSSFWSFQSHNKKINAIYSPFNSIVKILAQKLYFNLFGYIGNLDTFLTIDVSFFHIILSTKTIDQRYLLFVKY